MYFGYQVLVTISLGVHILSNDIDSRVREGLIVKGISHKCQVGTMENVICTDKVLNLACFQYVQCERKIELSKLIFKLITDVYRYEDSKGVGHD